MSSKAKKTVRPLQKTSKYSSASYTKKEKTFLQDTVKGLGILLIIFIIIGYCIFYFLSNKPSIKQSCKEAKQYISQHQSQLQTLLTQSFDQASKCPENSPECLASNMQELVTQFPDTGELSNYSSTYFIRAEGEEHIAKLFLSGRYQKDPADTVKEKEVMKVLRGEKKEICADGFKSDVNFTTMTYLKDFIVEAEIIEPIKDGDKVVGAMVRLYGD